MSEVEQTTENKPTGFSKIKKNLPEVDLSQQEIEVTVTDPVVSTGINKFVSYKVQGTDAEGPFDCMRRYSDFDKLRETLANSWPGCFVPPLPPKKSSGNMEAAFIEERRRHLEFFLQRCAKKPHLWYSEEMKCLTRGFGDVEKQLKQIPKQTQDSLINKYQEAFKDLAEKEINTDIIVKISTFQQYLQKINLCLTNFKTMGDNMLEVQGKHNEMFLTFFNFLLPEYEKNCLVEYGNGNAERYIFNTKENEKFNESIQVMKDFTQRQEFVKFIDICRMELNEVDSFKAVFKNRQVYEDKKNKSNSTLKALQIDMQKIMAGKGGSILKKQTKEQQIEECQAKIDAAQTDNDQINFLCDMMTVILGHMEIDCFKLEKCDIYYNVLKQLATFETEFAQAKIEMWGNVLENENISKEQQ